MTSTSGSSRRVPAAGTSTAEADPLWITDDVPPAATADPRPGWSRQQRLAGFAVVSLGTAITWWTLVAAGVRVTTDDLGISWQLIGIDELGRDPLGSVWYLHTQPPLHNLVVGSVLRWSPFPAVGTLVALYALALVGTGLLLTDVLARWRVHPVAAGLVSALALANPNLLTTVGVASYEVPVTLLLVASLWWFQRSLQRPGLVPLVGLAATLTALAMTRSLFHPAFVVAVVVLAGVARRIAWRHVVVALAIPVLVVGGWMLKNQVVFGTPTLSSWLGFNLQRGVVATMERDDVERDVADGRVTSLALEYPWGELGQYQAWLDGCRADHDQPATADAIKYRVQGVPIANFNHECYLPLYEESQANAIALVKAHPGQYLRSRGTVVVASFAVASIGNEDPGFGTSKASVDRTWMDEAGDVLLVPVHVDFRMGSWNLPLFGDAPISFEISLTLALLAAGVVLRSGLAAVRLVRVGWADRRERWSTDELLWLQAGLCVVLVVLVGDLIEFGENGRFRSLVDPLLVALPLAALVRLVTGRFERSRGAGRGPDDGRPGPDDRPGAVGGARTATPAG